MSAILPKGTSRLAEDSRNAVAIQPSVTASNDSSFPIAGRAIFTAEPMKGNRKEAIVATRSTTPLLVPVSLPAGLDTSAIIAHLASKSGDQSIAAIERHKSLYIK